MSKGTSRGRRKVMQPPRGPPPVELSQQEEQVMKRIRKAKRFVFLRQHRHELLNEAFQEELAGLYRKAERGRCPVAPAMLALAIVLQAYTGVSDDEAIEATLMDRRVEVGLGWFYIEPGPVRKRNQWALRWRLLAAQMGRWSD